MNTTPLTLETVLGYAVRLEEMGARFYRTWAERADRDDLKKFFRFLAEEETGHQKIFEGLRDRAGAAEQEPAPSEGAYDAHFRDMTSAILFNDEEVAAVHSLAGALALAKKQEMDAQLFYTDLLMYLSADALDMVRRIIEEEDSHFQKLSALEKKLFGR